MSVPNQVPVSNHVGNGVTTIFPYTFLVLEAGDLRVSVGGVLKTEGLDYIVSGLTQLAGGSVAFASPPASLASVSLVRKVPLLRSTDYQYAGDFNAATVNRDIDRVVMMIQDSGLAQANAVRFPAGDPSDGALPSSAERALKTFAFDADGNIALSSAAGNADILAAALLSTTASTGSALVGFNPAVTYPAGSLGAALSGVGSGLADNSTPTGKNVALIGYRANRTGSVGRTLADVLHERYSLLSAGGLGNNVFLNNAVLAAGLTAMTGAGLTAPAGTYKLTAGTFGLANTTLQLDPGTRLTSTAGAGSLLFADNSGLIGFNEGANQDVWYWGRRFSGARASGVGAVNAGSSPNAFMFDVRSDSADVGGNFSIGLVSRMIFGGSAAKGGRMAIYGVAEQQNGATNAASTNRNYVGVTGSAYAYAGDGGTFGNEKGGYFGLAGAAYADNTSQYLMDLTGGEYNTFVGPGAVGIKHNSGISIAGCNAQRGTLIDCGIRISAQSGIDATYTGHVGWNHGITFTDSNGADPITATGDLINTYWRNGLKRTLGRGFDLRGLIFSDEVLAAGDNMKLYMHQMLLADSGGQSYIKPNGPSVNANLHISGHGTGKVSVGPWASNADAAVNGYITVCDPAGNLLKIATIA